jgi:Xaa-Pro aminopeptidase
MHVTAIGPDEYRRRRDRALGNAETDALLLWSSARIFYLSGFPFIPTERPIALIVTGGESVLFVPRLEREHAEAVGHADRVVSYPEYPDRTHPLELLAELLDELGIGHGRLAADGDGYGNVFGYRGPRLSALRPLEIVPIGHALDDQMMLKSEHEIALVRESARWAGRAHRLLQDGTRPGLTETEVSARASFEAGQELLADYGGGYQAFGWGRSGPFAGYRGQIGAHSALPHSLNINAVFEVGDTLVTGASCPMFGYYSELERTMILGEPSAEQRTYFAHMLALQDLAIDLCRAGNRCSDVDRAVRAYYDRHDLAPTWRHHTGHAIGILYHEGPFLDIGDDRGIEPGMLFTVEPGIYLDGLGGFRHSDTILVTEGDPEFLTDYPRDLESLTIPV